MKKLIFIGYFLLILSLTGCQGSTTPSVLTAAHQNQLYISAWFATYDAERGLDSFTHNVRLMNEINPVWYNLNPAHANPGAPPFETDLRKRSEILFLARTNGVKLLPTIQNFGTTNFDPAVISTIINDPSFRAKHIQEIVDLIVTENYDGIDIDYENLPAGEKTAFSAFITELSFAIHQHQKLLSVTVYAKTSESSNWTGPGAQDWSVLVSQADSLKIMAYDYHWVTSEPGPISPLDWLEDILGYARRIPGAKGKIIVGLPFYGINWGTSGKEVMYQDASAILNQYPYINYSREPMDQSNNVEIHFIYNKNGTSHTVYFQDRAALSERLKLMNQYRDLVKGVTFWHLGGEDPGSWDELRSYHPGP